MALVLVMVGLLVIALLGATLVGGLLPDPLRAEVPVDATATASPSERFLYPTPQATPLQPAPSTAPVWPDLGERIDSERYGYSIWLPAGWELTASAAKTWTSRGPSKAGETDLFSHPTGARTFEIARRPVPAGMADEGFLEQYVQPAEATPRSSGCSYNGGPITGPYIGSDSDAWAEIPFRAHRLRVRAGCRRIDAVYFTKADAYVMTISQIGLQLNVLDRLLSAIEFGPRADPVAFQSLRYGYSIEIPSGWTGIEASSSWTDPGTQRPTLAMRDVLTGPSQEDSPRLTIAATSKPQGISEDRFVADAAPLPDAVRIEGPTVSCTFGDSIVERGPVPSIWSVDVIGGHRAHVRAMCGTVDAVVFVGNRGYLFTLESGTATTGDLERFRDLVASVRFDDGLVRFVSDAYGYSMRYPRGWKATLATQPWEGGSADEGIDRFASGSDDPFARFGLAAHALGPGQTEDGWVASYVPRIKGLFGTTCRFGSAQVLAPKANASWQPTIIDGRSARLRAACGQVDGVVFDDGVGYWLTLTTNERRTGADVSAFNELADTIDLDAVPSTFVAVGQEPAAPTQTFTSARFGYTIKIPADWQVEPAPKRKRGESLEARRTADRFAEPLESPRRFSVTARPLHGGVVDDAWLGSYVPDPSAATGTICRQVDGTPRSILSYMSAGRIWRETVVAGRPARLRGLCGQVQAVIQVGDTAFILTSFRSDTAVWAFRQIADTFRISP